MGANGYFKFLWTLLQNVFLAEKHVCFAYRHLWPHTFYPLKPRMWH